MAKLKLRLWTPTEGFEEELVRNNMVINIVKGRRYRKLKCLACNRELITRQKRAKIDNKTYCLKCALSFMDKSIVFHKKKIVELRKLKRRIRPKDLVIEAL